MLSLKLVLNVLDRTFQRGATVSNSCHKKSHGYWKARTCSRIQLWLRCARDYCLRRLIFLTAWQSTQLCRPLHWYSLKRKCISRRRYRVKVDLFLSFFFSVSNTTYESHFPSQNIGTEESCHEFPFQQELQQESKCYSHAGSQGEKNCVPSRIVCPF